jgi:tripartite-type tricarboxylate transporter receptor subunit TctC
MIESGFPGFEAYGWIGIFAPAGTPEAAIARLHREFVVALSDPEVLRRLHAAGVEAIGSTPQELDQWVRKDYDKWVKFLRETKLRFE